MQQSRNRREEHFSVWNLALLKSSLNFPVLKIIIDQSLPYMAFLKGRFKNNVLIIINKFCSIYGECFSHFSSVVKNSQVLILLNNARETSVLFLLQNRNAKTNALTCSKTIKLQIKRGHFTFFQTFFL